MALVVIPVLAPSLDKSLKEDKSLYPVRTLFYYLARTKDLCKGKNLAFVPFWKSFIRILFQLPSLPGSRKLCCNATSFLMSKPRPCIKSEPMVFKPLLLPRHSQGVSPWTRSSQWLYQPWLQLWIDPSSLIGPSVQSERYVTIWTGPQAE